MKKTRILLPLLGAAVLVGLFAVPKPVRADNLDIHAGGVNVDIHDGDGDHRHHHHWLHHEEMDKALGALRDARAHLDRGGHDFGGHRIEAIHAADHAIREIQASIDFANSHER